ncbi:MAG: sigma factor-like helix-turn-helix DNA-binding protein [Pseudomonadota bacterium]
MTEEQYEALQQRLDAILVLLSLNLPEEKSGKPLMVALDQAGLAAKDIARILGVTANNVRVTLHRARKEK